MNLTLWSSKINGSNKKSSTNTIFKQSHITCQYMSHDENMVYFSDFESVPARSSIISNCLAPNRTTWSHDRPGIPDCTVFQEEIQIFWKRFKILFIEFRIFKNPIVNKLFLKQTLVWTGILNWPKLQIEL